MIEFKKPIKMEASKFFEKYPTGFFGKYTGPLIKLPAIEIVGDFKDKVRIDMLPYINLDCQGNADGVTLSRLDFPSSQGIQVMAPRSNGVTMISCRQPHIGSITTLEGNEDDLPAISIRSEAKDRGDSTNAFMIGSVFVGNCNNAIGLSIEGGGKSTGLGACREGYIGYYWMQSPWDKEALFQPKSRTAVYMDWCLNVNIANSLFMFDPEVDRHTIADIRRSKDCKINGSVRHPKRTTLPPTVQDAVSQMNRNIVTMQLNPRDAI